MNIIFFGSSNFAVPCLRALLAAGQKVSCVVTQPDKQKGRGLHFAGTAIKAAAKEAGIEVYQPDNVNAPQAIKFLQGLNPDLFIVVSYGQILSQEVLDTPKIFSLNAHASLLPKYRGAAPINWAIINQEKATGVSVIKMTKEMDAGALIRQKARDISDDDNIITLEDKLSKVAADLLVDCIRDIKNNDYKLVAQDEDRVSFAPKLKKEDGLIDWDKPARQINHLIRAVLIWPGAFTYYQGKLLKIYKASVSPLARLPVCPSAGEIIEASKDRIVVATGEDNLVVEELQIEGKRRMSAAEFIAGHKIQTGERLEKSPCIKK